ncbi:hypothetical protein LL936_11470 [Levilactobacillus brevis]|uniref:Uncharacterized protein n=2 Tax=Levilactobacillus brevis TaxID=1580 RepID=A0AB38X4I6_LEVBR|nr:hypothetical protein [Levilactobacillus brevis]MBU7540649.1 hypothetical protein [Levilactobacillus brevis]MBU7557972.1 hypothetical protein [Levilactobacillus brevis]MBU7566805.1 hypothetical protein [Levilactobacillus brevis]MCE6009465.1 hypothetical protein [Levilactobacillus brevis]MCE6013939.1 hypothetical protein [Levilactobacillus brevis]
MRTNIMRLQRICSNYLSAILLIMGLILLVVGVGGWLGWYAATMLAGVSLIVLALLINYEEKEVNP